MKIPLGLGKVLCQTAFGLGCLILASLVSCNNDNDEEQSASIVGEWTISNTTMDLSIESKSLTQYLMDALGISEQEAEIFNDLLEETMLEFFTGTIEFKDDNSYVMHFGGETDNGTYSLSADRKTLTIDPGTNDETVADVLALNATTLKIKMTQNAEEDLDDDGTDEHFNMNITMTLTR